jgi:hypothetical protein
MGANLFNLSLAVIQLLVCMVVRFFYRESFLEAEPKSVFPRLGVQPAEEEGKWFRRRIFKECQSIVLGAS